MRTEGCVAVAPSSFSQSLYWPSAVARFCAEIGDSHMIDELLATINGLAQFGACIPICNPYFFVSYIFSEYGDVHLCMSKCMTHYFRWFKKVSKYLGSIFIIFKNSLNLI